MNIDFFGQRQIHTTHRAGFQATRTRAMASTSMTTGVDLETDNGKRLHFLWVPEVGSTQDEMKALLATEVS